jgi:hypothetical protein
MKISYCCICCKEVESLHFHQIGAAFRVDLEAAVGRTLPKKGLCCCSHFEAHNFTRFTRHQPAVVLKEFTAPQWTAPPVRVSRVTNRLAEQTATPTKSTSQRLKEAEAKLSASEKKVTELEFQLKEARKPFLWRLVQLDDFARPVGKKNAAELMYWCGVSSLDPLLPYLESLPTPKRGKKRVLSCREELVLTLIFLRRVPSFRTCAAFGDLPETTANDAIDRLLMKSTSTCFRDHFINIYTIL